LDFFETETKTRKEEEEEAVSLHEQVLEMQQELQEVAAIEAAFTKVIAKRCLISGTSRAVDAPLIIGIAGGSGSGKTTLTKQLMREVGEENVALICHDSYYKDFGSLSMEERCEINFDHPDSLDSSLLCEHLHSLKAKKQVAVPNYDFKTHSREETQTIVAPKRIILVDGILLFADPHLSSLLDLKVFVDTTDDVRLGRRLLRDVKERQRSVTSVLTQYHKTVKPMHQLFVEPSKKKADIIFLADDRFQEAALDALKKNLKLYVEEEEEKEKNGEDIFGMVDKKSETSFRD